MSYTLLDHNGIKFGISSKKICRNCIKHGHWQYSFDWLLNCHWRN
jgi:hypothetical protein